jgi:hypothetical protein
MEEREVALALEAMGLKVSQEKLPGVKAQFERIGAIAQALEKVELDPFTDEMAPVWRP